MAILEKSKRFRRFSCIAGEHKRNLVFLLENMWSKIIRNNLTGLSHDIMGDEILSKECNVVKKMLAIFAPLAYISK